MSTEELLYGGHPLGVQAQKWLEGLSEAWGRWDALVDGSVKAALTRIGFVEIDNPSLASSWPLVSSSTPLLTSWLIYLTVVFAGLAFWRSEAGCRTRRQRGGKDPVWLRSVVQAHNLFLIGLSMYMCSTTIFQAWKNGYVFWGTGYRQWEAGMARIIYIFYVSKIYEYFDTAIMLLKGNVHQVSILHVYHHISISFFWWMITYVAPGGDAWYSAALNSLVHVLMYTYYFLASVLGKDLKLRKRYLWWGKYMTQFQMVQFITLMVQGAYCYYFSSYPKFLSGGIFWYMQTLLLLFMEFYMQKHGSKKKVTKEE